MISNPEDDFEVLTAESYIEENNGIFAGVSHCANVDARIQKEIRPNGRVRNGYQISCQDGLERLEPGG